MPTIEDAIIADPVTLRAFKIQWPIIWAFVWKLLPILLPLLLGQQARHAPTLGVGATLPPDRYPDSLRKAIEAEDEAKAQALVKEEMRATERWGDESTSDY